MCFGCSKEPSDQNSSFEYPQHMFWMRNKENSFPIRTLIWRPVPGTKILFRLFSHAPNRESDNSRSEYNERKYPTLPKLTRNY